MLDDTLVVFWTDHGEQFMERGVFGHGVSLYAEENAAAAAFWARNLRPYAFRRPTVHEDIAPTVLDLLDVPPAYAMDGAVVGTAPIGRSVRAFHYLDGESPKLMVTADHRQINYTWYSGGVSYFRNDLDPKNLIDRFDPEDPDVQVMLGELHDYIDDVQILLPTLGEPAPLP